MEIRARRTIGDHAGHMSAKPTARATQPVAAAPALRNRRRSRLAIHHIFQRTSLHFRVHWCPNCLMDVLRLNRGHVVRLTRVGVAMLADVSSSSRTLCRPQSLPALSSRRCRVPNSLSSHAEFAPARACLHADRSGDSFRPSPMLAQVSRPTGHLDRCASSARHASYASAPPRSPGRRRNCYGLGRST